MWKRTENWLIVEQYVIYDREDSVGVILKVVIIISMEPEESACVRLFIK